MRLPRVYHPGPLQVGRVTALDEAGSNHLVRVLRMRVGDRLIVFDGSGGEYRGAIEGVARAGVRVRIERHDPVERESALQVGLAQVVSAGERMDFTVQKAVELGAAWIQPLTARRAKVRLEPARAERRVTHWQRVAIAACEQCGRNRVPSVRPLLELYDWLGTLAGTERGMLLDPDAALPLSAAERPAGELLLLAGAEAGFDPEESALLQDRGFLAVRLGPRVLRTETAALAALAAMQALWGDF
jgi:16S rRNA (uracil1498-N3)-methyltransferase